MTTNNHANSEPNGADHLLTLFRRPPLPQVHTHVHISTARHYSHRTSTSTIVALLPSRCEERSPVLKGPRARSS